MNKKKIIGGIALAGLLAVAAAAAWLFLYEPQYSGPFVVGDKPVLFAHRGFGNHGPDNSLYGVDKAFAAGVDGVDVDGQLTADGQLVIFHDLSVDRLTSGSGRVDALTLDQMLALDLGPVFDPEITGAFVHTFETFVKATKGKGILMVELKAAGTANTGIEEQAVRIVQAHKAHDRVLLSSFNPVVLYRLKSLDPDIKTVFAFMDTNWNPKLLAEIPEEDRVTLPWFLQKEWTRRAIRKLTKPDLLSVNIEVDVGTVRNLQAKGWPVMLWSPITREAMDDALEKRPYAVITDEPFLILDP